MITLEQIRRLDEKVQQAVQFIQTLKSENESLRGRLSEYEGRISELEVLITRFREDQGEIEQGIVRALQHLDELEDTISPTTEEPSGQPADASDGTDGIRPRVVEEDQAPAEEVPEQSADESTPAGEPAPASDGETDEGEAGDQDAELDIF